MTTEGPFVGRDKEIARIGDALSRADQPAVVIVGDAGVGKTRLSVASLDLASEAGYATIRVCATKASAAIPLGPLAPLLPPTRGAGAALADLLRHTKEHLVRATGDRPLVVVVDDAHLLDDASATLIHQLVASDTIFAIVIVRAGETPPDPITTLWKDALAERLDVGPLDREATTELISLLLSGRVDDQAATELWRSSGGNPLFTRELVLDARASGSLANIGGRWRLDGALTVPGTLVEAVERRLADLSDDERGVLELVALGEPLGAGLLESVIGEGAERMLEHLEKNGYLIAQPSGRRLEVRLAHPLHGEVLREQVPVLASRRIRVRLAGAVEACGARRSGDALHIATWRIDAGLTLDAGTALIAARQAEQRFDRPLAIRLAEAALAAGGGFDAELELAQLRASDPAAAGARDVLARLADAAVDDDQRGRVAIARFDVLSFILADHFGALRVAEEAESLIDDVSWRAELAARRAFLFVLGGFAAEGMKILDAIPADDLSNRATIWVAAARGLGASDTGEFEAGLDHVRRGRAALASHGWSPSLPEPSVLTVAELRILVRAGRVFDAETTALRPAPAEASEQGRALHDWARATIALSRGLPSSASELCETAIASFARASAPDLGRLAMATLAMSHATHGDAGAADDALERADALPGMTDPPHVRHARAWTRAAHGEVQAAADVLEGLARDQRDQTPVFAMLALLDLVRLGGSRRAVPLLFELNGRIEGDLIGAAADFADAAVRDDGDRLLESSVTFERMGMTLVAAEAATAAGAAFIRGGRPGRCTQASDRTATLLSACEGARTPGLIAADLQAALTAREREVAMLAVRGLSNVEIAERLGVSKRTVDAQLQSAYDKLGVDGRAGLVKTLDGSFIGAAYGGSGR